MAQPSTLSQLPRRINRAGGFTYLSLIILLSIISLITVSALKLGSVLQRSRAEQELLDIGAAFSDALKSYADATPEGQAPQPPSLKELLRDPRLPGTRRHLRKIFVDPITGKAEWGIVYLGDKTGVLAVYSLSDARPVKVGNFPLRYSGFEGKNRISEWKFTMAVGGSGTPPTPEKQAKNQTTVAVPQQSSGSQQGNLAAPISPRPETLPEPANPADTPTEELAFPSETAPPSEPEKPPEEPLTK